MVPAALGADLDHVASDLSRPAAEFRELRAARRAPTVRRELRAEHVGHVHEHLVLADRTALVQPDADVPGCTDELRVSVADIELGEPSLAEVLHHGIAC